MRQLIEMSHNISIDRNISVDKYFKSGRELLKSAAALEQKGDIEKAFVLYLRYMTLFLEKLNHHPDYSKADKAEKALVMNECNKVFELAETLKKRINEKYAEEFENSKRNSIDSQAIVRNVKPCEGARNDCDVDDIDKKFNFSQMPSGADQTQDKVFDPFNIEELKKSFN